MTESDSLFEIFANGQPVDDSNPIVIDDDSECLSYLKKIKDSLSLTEKETRLLDLCVKTVTSDDGSDVGFGLSEILKLGKLALKYPSLGNEIMACSHHIIFSLDFDGDIPVSFYPKAIDAYHSLGDILTKTFRKENEDEDEDEDEDEEEEEEEEENKEVKL